MNRCVKCEKDLGVTGMAIDLCVDCFRAVPELYDPRYDEPVGYYRDGTPYYRCEDCHLCGGDCDCDRERELDDFKL